MDTLNINEILDRNNAIDIFKNTLSNFEKNKNNLATIKGIYVYGTPGSGKTYFVKQILKQLNYDIICYNAGDIRNKNVFDLITDNNMGDTNILSLFQKKPKKNCYCYG